MEISLNARAVHWKNVSKKLLSAMLLLLLIEAQTPNGVDYVIPKITKISEIMLTGEYIRTIPVSMLEHGSVFLTMARLSVVKIPWPN